MNNYIFPFQKIEKNEDFVLYGAGNVGKCFYKQIITSKYAHLVAWVDRKFSELQKEGLPVSDVENIHTMPSFSHIVIAIDNEFIASQVRDELKNNFNIPEDKIVWASNYRFANNGLFLNQDQQKEYGIAGELTQISPKEMLRSYRLDLAVRYLMAKDIINGVENRDNISLYSRMLLIRTNAEENDKYYYDTERRGTWDYINSVKKLCESIKDNGFIKERFIPLGDNGVFLNGAHRIAVSLALEEDIWVTKLPGKNGNVDYDFRWFDENGFNTQDKIRILRAYADIYEQCGIIVLFGPCKEQWNYIEKQLTNHMCIVGHVDLDFSDNYIAYENLFREIYADPLWRNVYIDRKIELLMMDELIIRVILVSDEGFESEDLYKKIEAYKLELRARMFFDTDIAPVVMHGSNSKEEYIHLKQILLSVNNLEHLKMRVTRNYSDEFIGKLDELKGALREKNISEQDVVISGSSGWEIFGLRKADDIDFIVLEKYRKKYGYNTISWTDNIDYTRKNSIKVDDDTLYQDELLINDDNYHYIFYGLKFVNLSLMARKKGFDKRNKDVRDCRLYELFKDYSKNFNNKTLLKEQIERVFYRKR